MSSCNASNCILSTKKDMRLFRFPKTKTDVLNDLLIVYWHRRTQRGGFRGQNPPLKNGVQPYIHGNK